MMLAIIRSSVLSFHILLRCFELSLTPFVVELFTLLSHTKQTFVLSQGRHENQTYRRRGSLEFCDFSDFTGS